MQVKIVLKLFKNKNFSGTYRYCTKDEPLLGNIGMNDSVSSLIVYKGPDYTRGDAVQLYEHSNYEGAGVILEPAVYPDISRLFDKNISSVRYINTSAAYDAQPVRLIVRLFKNANYGGEMRTIFYNEADLGNQAFYNATSSIKVFTGPDYSGQSVDFFMNPCFSGKRLLPGSFKPGARIPDLELFSHNFNNRISSVLIHD